VQVYDKQWKFIRGWWIDAGGGDFKLRISDTNTIHVITARKSRHYIYDLNGNLLSSSNAAAYGKYPSDGTSYIVPTASWLWIFSSPFLSWLTAAAGMGLLFVSKKVMRGIKTHKASVDGHSSNDRAN
jgi:hypothetical protein